MKIGFCLCGGELEYYKGSLGYEGLKCLKCGFMWDGTTPEEHKKQEDAYKLVLEHTLTHEDYKKLEELEFIKC